MILISIVPAIFTGGSSFFNMLFYDRNDYFMDFFNSVSDALGDPYSVGHVIYPPLTVLFYEGIGKVILALFTPVDGGLSQAFQLRGSAIGLLIFLLTVFVFLFIFAAILLKLIHKKDVKLPLLGVLLISLSYPVLFAIDRGNSILFSFLFSFLFVILHNHDNKRVRYVSYLCLAIATSIKIFPVFFWLILLREKNWKGAVVCAIIIAVLFFVPFLFTDGSFGMMLESAMSYSSSGHNVNGIINLGDLTNIILISAGMESNHVSIVAYVYVLFCTVSVVFDDKLREWQTVLLIASILILGPGFGAEYLFIYAIIPLILFLRGNVAKSRFNLFVIFVFVIVLAVMPEFFSYVVTGTYKAMLFLALSLFVLSGSYGRLIRKVTKRADPI